MEPNTLDMVLLLLIWIAAALVFPKLLKRFHFPWVTAVIFAGVFLGPKGLGLVNPGDVMNFLATLGLVFLMFTSGLDTKFSVLKKAGRDVLYFSAVNFSIPFAVGFTVGYVWGIGVFASLLLGICFSSSSVGVISPMLRELNVDSKVKSTMTSAVFIEDVLSLILLAILLRALGIAPVSAIPLIFFPAALLVFFLGVFYLIPILQEWLFYWERRKDVFAGQIRTVIITLSLVALMAELIGVHAMVGGFLAGLTLSDMLARRSKLHENVFALSYGFLIPIFLLHLGMTTNIAALFSPGDAAFTLLIVISLMGSKSASGYLGARLAGFTSFTSLGMGLMTSAQMSTTLATASIAVVHGIFSEQILASLVVMSIISIVTAPLLTKLLLGDTVDEPSKFTRLWQGEGDLESLKDHN